MSESKAKQQALAAFAKSCERTIIPRRAGRGRAYDRWRLHASVARRFILYSKTGLPVAPALIQMFFDANAVARRARAAMTRDLTGHQ